jgi:pyruvate/2-oxoglutarate dehydrogenase complex dihydrolipoamide acyltransferase (E2) component
VSEEPFYLPKLGMQMQEGTIVSWLKQPGDPVAAGEPICVIETDKVEAELESDVAGTVARIETPAGETVPVGTVLATIEVLG